MREQIAVIVNALMLSTMSNCVKRMSDEKRDKAMDDLSAWAVDEIMKAIQGDSNESTNTPFAG